MKALPPSSVLKQEFILELLAFSPRYNEVTARQIADRLDEPSLEKLTSLLRQVNQANAEKLAELEEKDASAFEKKMEEQISRENQADDLFYKQLEKQLLREGGMIDEKLQNIEDKANQVLSRIEEAIEEHSALGIELLNSIKEELKKEE